MTLLPHFRNQQRGSILVVCMVLAALGTIGVAAWISLIDARGNQVQYSYDAMKRRATLQSSKALAYDALYTNHLHAANGVTSRATYTVKGRASAAKPSDAIEYANENVASVTISPYSGAPLQNSAATRTTKNGVTPFRSFTTDVEIALDDNTSIQTANVQLRSYNPALAGDLLVMHPSYAPNAYESHNVAIEGNLVVNGRAVLWDVATKDLKGGLVAEEYVLQNETLVSISGTHDFPTPSGGTTIPSNYPIPIQTTGVAGSDPAYKGELDIVSSASNSQNDYATRWAAAGTVATISGSSPKVLGPGPGTAPDGTDDATLEADIESKNTAELMTTLPASYPLSSRLLRAVADKTSPTAFTEDELFSIFSSHIPIPDDALSYLTSTHIDKIAGRAEELHADNGTHAHSDGANKVEIYLSRADLPHIIATEAHEIIVHGQQDATEAGAAAAMDPVGIAINNTGTDSIHALDFRGQNRRRIVFAVATEQNSSPPTYGYDAEIAFSGPDPFPEWHMILELQNTGALLSAAAVNNAIIVGGIRGSRPINIYEGTVTLNQQFNVDGYEEILSRNAWVETYMTP